MINTELWVIVPAVVAITAAICRRPNVDDIQPTQTAVEEYTPAHRCIHSRVEEIPGEPTIGSYFQCDDCAMNFHSHGHWIACSRAAEQFNRRHNV